MSVQRRIAAVGCRALVAQLSMQRFAQEGRWRLDKQSPDFFRLILVASVLQNASGLIDSYYPYVAIM